MPEIWLNYGTAQVVLDLPLENLGQQMNPDGTPLKSEAITERLGTLDLSRQADLVILHDSQPVRSIIESVFALCELKSLPRPNVLADQKTAARMRTGLPEGCTVGEFGSLEQPDTNPIFVGEVEFDGLFGYETVATRLTRRFGAENMLAAYAKRRSNSPAPGHVAESLAEATKFADGFEIRAVELAANHSGIVDIAVGHPSQTAAVARSLESTAIKDVEPTKSIVVSPGRHSTSNALSRALSSLWNCRAAVKKAGLAILVAECMDGLGSESLRQYVEGRLSIDRLRTPPKYIDGMEGLLYLHEVQKELQVGLVSVLPDLYVKKLGMVPLPGIQQSLDYVLKATGYRQKISIVPDGARLLLR